MRSFTGVVAIFLPVFLGWYIVMMLFGGVTILSTAFGLTAGAFLLQFTTLKSYTFSCPENTAYLAVNTITKELYVITQGLSFRFPWDKIDDSNKFSLDLRNEDLKTIGETSERGQVAVSIRLSWRPDASSTEQLTKFNALGKPEEAQKKVASALLAAVQAVVNQVTPQFNLDTIRTSTADVKERVVQLLGIGNGQSNMEKRFGVEVDNVEIGDVSPTAETQKVNNLRVKFQVYVQQALEMTRLIPGMQPKQALEALLAADPDSNALKVMGNGFVFPGFGQGGNGGGNP